MGAKLTPGRRGARLAQLCALGIASVAIIAIVGWKFDVAFLTRISTEYVPIAPSTAFGLLAFAGAMFAAAQWPERRGATGAALAVAAGVALVAGLVLLEAVAGVRSGIEDALQVGPQVFHALPLARMSPLAAALFLLAAGSLAGTLVRPARGGPVLVEISAACGALVLAGGIVVTGGYLLGSPLLYGGPVKPVALPAGVAFMLVGVGLLVKLNVLLRRSDMKAVAIVALGLGVAVSFGLYAIVETAERAVVSPHVPWRGRTVLAGGLVFSWLLALYVRAQGKHNSETEAANRSLRAAEARLRAVIESAADAIVTTDARGTIVFWNAAAERIFGYTAKEVSGLTSAELMPERFREAHLRGLMRAADSGEFRLAGSTVELAGLRKSGVEFPLELSLARWKVDDDIFFTSILRDIGERRHAEELEAAVLKISRAANEAADLGALLRSVHEAVKRLMDARNFYIALYDPNSSLLTFPYFVDEFDPPPAPRRSGRGMTEYVLRSGKPQFISPEVFEDLVQRGEIEPIGTPPIDWVGVPLLVEGRAIGALVVQSYTEGTRFCRRDLDILTFVSQEVALAVDRRHAHDDLARSEARYRAVVEDQTELICRFRPDGEVMFLNEAYRRYFGRARKAAIGSNILDVLPERDAAALRDGLAVLGPDNPVGSFRLQYESPDLGERMLAWTYRAIGDESGRPAEIQAVGRDITEQVKLEAQIREAQRMETVAVLAGGVAHEFNNDLQSILATTQVLAAHRTDAERFATAVARLEETVKRSASHTRQLLVFANQDVSRREPLDLNVVVAASAGLFAGLVPGSIGLSVDLPSGRLPVDGDRGQLDQVLANLVVNAVDSMPHGGALTVRTGRAGEGFAFLEVRDTGVGIPEDVRSRLFEPFFTTKEGGTGLGLSVTRGIVTGMGGRIEVDSEVGSGTTFRIELPLRVVGDNEAGGVSVAARGGDAATGNGERILVVEDEEGARKGLVEALGMLGYNITEAGSGEAALKVAENAAFDLLLTDIRLPGLQGWAVARSLKAHCPSLKVILMSGYTEDAAIRAEASNGAARFLQKPFDIKTLAHEMRAALDEARGAS